MWTSRIVVPLVIVLGCSGDDEPAATGGGGTTSTTTTAEGGGGASTSSATDGSGAATSSGLGGAGGDGAGGGASTTTATSSGGGAGGNDGCGAVGQACDGECPDELVCEGRGPDAFCATPASECGGIAGTTCPEGTECMYYSGADFGRCATPAERQCICENAPGAVVDCGPRD